MEPSLTASVHVVSLVLVVQCICACTPVRNVTSGMRGHFLQFFLCRFPLFGGWQTRHYIGYNLPSYENLYHSGSHYMLQMRFVDHIFDDQVIDKATLKIILPEGAK